MSSAAAATRLGIAPEVLLRDDVGAAAVGVGVDRLAIREGDDRQDHGDDDADRRHEGERSNAADEQDPQDLLGRVGDRGQRVRRQHGQAGDSGEAFVMGEVRRDRCADEQAFDLQEQAFR